MTDSPRKAHTYYMSFTVPAALLPATHEKIAKLNKRAAKAGIPAVASLTEIDRRAVTERTEPFGIERTYEVVEFEIVGVENVVLGEYRVAAVVDHDEAGNVLRSVPSFPYEIPAEYRTTAASRCDHCGKVRNRIETVLVYSEAEGFKQIGKQCVKLFLGVSPESLISWVSEADALAADDDEFGGYWGRVDYTVVEFVAAAALATAVYGFKPSSFDGESTKSVAWEILRPGKYFAQRYPELAAPSPVDIERANALAAESLVWIAETAWRGSDYLLNLKTAAHRHAVGKNDGLLASLPNAYKRHLAGEAERAAKAAAKAEQPASAFVGQVGDKVTVKATVVYTNRSAGYTRYAPDSLFVVLLAETGEKFFVSTTVETAVGILFENAKRDTVFNVTGTVKEHKVTDKGENVTVLTRCKAQEV